MRGSFHSRSIWTLVSLGDHIIPLIKHNRAITVITLLCCMRESTERVGHTYIYAYYPRVQYDVNWLPGTSVLYCTLLHSFCQTYMHKEGSETAKTFSKHEIIFARNVWFKTEPGTCWHQQPSARSSPKQINTVAVYVATFLFWPSQPC